MLQTRWLGGCVVGLSLLLGGPVQAASDRPLLMEGKQTLYQRVLSKPGAKLAETVGATGGRETVPFTVYYVYERRQQDGAEWLRVGRDPFAGSEGWIEGSQLIPWNQTLTISFRDPANGSRVLLFRDKASLKSLIDEGDADRYRKLYLEAIDGKLSDDSPVVAIQPAEPVDITEDFYLVPIIDHEDVYLGSEAATMLEVTTVPLAPDAETAGASPAATAGGEDGTDPSPAAAAGAEDEAQAARKARAEAEVAREQARQAALEQALRDYKSGLVFVIDSTKSMQPYIERTRQAVRAIYDRLAKAGVTAGMSFGVVAYRDDPGAVEGLEYRIKTIADLTPGENADRFFDGMDKLKAAEVSSQDFIEDAYAGVVTALDAIDWKGRDARYVVLITDAGARGPDDKLGSTGLDAERLNRMAREKNVVLLVLHLLTPAGTANHETAAAQYRKLSDYPGVGSLYYGVPAGDVTAFGNAVDAVAGQIAGQVKQTVAAAVDARLPEPPADPAEAERTEQAGQADQAEVPPPAPQDRQLAELQQKLHKLGHALRMQYLERKQDGKVPTVFNAWLVDRDFLHPAQATVDVRVLLTRDQLSDLHDLMRQVIDTFQEGLISPQGFLDNIRKLAATLSRDPERLGDAGSLSEMGFMKEYIEDLPYRSEAMTLTLEDWAEWPAKRQIEYINRLERKIAYYKALHDHTDLWVSLDGGPVDGQSVFPVELDMLP